MPAVKAVYQKICCAKDRGRAVDGAAALDARPDRVAPFHPDAPLVDRLAVGNPLVTGARHNEPGVGEAPAQRGILFAVVHVAPDPDAVDVLNVVGEEVGDVLVRRPVDRHAELIAVLGLESLLEIRAFEPVRPEPVEIRELLIRELVDLAVRGCGEADADEVVHIQGRKGHISPFSSHPVRQRDDLAVAEVGPDEIGVVDPGVIDVAVRLHLGLQLLDHVPLLDQIVGELDSGQLGERLCQHLGFVDVSVDGLGDHIDLHPPVGLGCLDEPLQLRPLLVTRQGGRCELVKPLLDRWRLRHGVGRDQPEGKADCESFLD
jgi:hypothetical protein